MFGRAFGYSRILRSPENDTGSDPETYDEVEETDEVDVEEEVDADEGDADEGEEDTTGAADGERSETSGRQEAGSVRQPSRAERRVEQALQQAKVANERAEALERRLAEQNRAPQETAAQRQERLSMMEPEDRINYLLREQGQRFEGELAQIRFQTADSADRTAFEGLCARNPVAGKLRDQVESYLAEMRSKGTTAPRETVLRYVIGDRALANAGRATGKATRRAADNTARQTTRPSSARGDTTGESRRDTNDRSARAKRLEDQPI